MKKAFKFFYCFICVAVTAAFCGCTSIFGRVSESVKPHLIALSEKESNPVRHINSASVETGNFSTSSSDSLVNQLNELFEIVVFSGKRPVFSGQSAEVKNVYDEAVKVLNRYIKNDFTYFERIHAIHDYLTSAIKYDEDLYLQHLDDPAAVSGDNDSFLLTGVFINKAAVCDGFAKAFSFLCAIEGIETEIIQGDFSYNDNAIPHVWNKVKLDAEWYNVDCTMDSIKFYPDKGDSISVIHHGFFLLSDKTLKDFGGHNFSGQSVGYSANKDYDFYKETQLFANTAEVFTMQADSAEELNQIFTFLKSSKRKYGQVELRLDLGLDDESANRLSAYESEILAAYGMVKDRDFSFNPEKGMYPFQKYPRGVFVFLVYK